MCPKIIACNLQSNVRSNFYKKWQKIKIVFLYTRNASFTYWGFKKRHFFTRIQNTNRCRITSTGSRGYRLYSARTFLQKTCRVMSHLSFPGKSCNLSGSAVEQKCRFSTFGVFKSTIFQYSQNTDRVGYLQQAPVGLGFDVPVRHYI